MSDEQQREPEAEAKKGGDEVQDMTTIERAPVEHILALRTAVLRPHFAPGELAHFDKDALASTRHYAAKRGGEVIGCASLMRRSLPHGKAEDAAKWEASWQLRGMAVLDTARGRGVGAMLLEAIIADLTTEALSGAADTLLWCNARERAVSLYTRAGFLARGEPFVVPHIGRHVRMTKIIEVMS